MYFPLFNKLGYFAWQIQFECLITYYTSKNLSYLRCYFYFFVLVKVQVEPHLKSLHLTLAYQFDVRQKEALKSLIKSTLNVPKSCLWELNLYSRDVAAVNKLVKIYFYY